MRVLISRVKSSMLLLINVEGIYFTYVKNSQYMCQRTPSIPSQFYLHHQRVDNSPSSNQTHLLDLEYLRIKDEIIGCHFYHCMKKAAKIRLNGWISKLDRIIANKVWKRNRNNHAKLINLMCQCEVIIEPFSSLPPHGDIANLTKHQVNAIIDMVELAVKSMTNQNDTLIKQQLKNQQPSIKTPKQHWQRVRESREKSRQKTYCDESSIYLGKSIEKSSLRQFKESFNLSQNFQKKKSSDVKDSVAMKQNVVPLMIRANQTQKVQNLHHCETNKTIRQFYLNSSSKKKMDPVSKISEQITSAYFSKNIRIPTSYSQVSYLQDPPLIYRDQHESIQVINRTLQTEVLDQSSIVGNNEGELRLSHLSECNFQDDFSERCKTKEEVLIKNYFSWKKDLKMSQGIKVKQLNLFENLKKQCSNDEYEKGNKYSLSGNISSNNDIGEQQTIQSGKISEQTYLKAQKKLYWESNSVSFDLSYQNDGQNISIDECQQLQICDEGISYKLNQSLSKLQQHHIHIQE